MKTRDKFMQIAWMIVSDWNFIHFRFVQKEKREEFPSLFFLGQQQVYIVNSAFVREIRAQRDVGGVWEEMEWN